MTLVRETAIEQYAISIDDKEFYEVPCIFKHFYSDVCVYGFMHDVFALITTCAFTSCTIT